MMNAETEEEDEKEERIRKKSKFFGLIPAIAGVIAFILTEDMRLPMIMTDRWTLLMVVILLSNLVLAYVTRNKEDDDDEDEEEGDTLPAGSYGRK